MQLPILYKTNKNGSTQICDITISANVITTTFGQLDGKLQTKTDTIAGKNIGRSNATTDNQQAILEAESKHTKKIKSGYTLIQGDAPVSKLPMKVGIWESKRFLPGILTTDKLNGVNGTYRRANGILTLTSRGGELFPELPHLHREIHQAMDLLKCNELNGELYKQKTHLQDITSAVKATKPSSATLEFHIFDAPDLDLPFTYRNDLLKAATFTVSNVHVFFVIATPCPTIDHVEAAYNLAMWSGCEGTVLKLPSAEYVHGVRSSSMWKYKKAVDAEFQVVGYNFDKNNHVVYQCSSPGGDFSVKRKGTNAQRLADATIVDTNLKKFLTVEFECYSKSGKPTKPVGLCFRDCDINGDPLV